MNVWIKKTRKQGTCVYCLKPILKGEYQVFCQWYVRLATGRVWKNRKIFHIPCWVENGIAGADRKVVVDTRGGRRLEMTDSDRDARFAILRRRAAVTQRIKVEVVKSPQNMDRIIHLGDLLNRLKEEIEPYGGAPKSWN